MTGAKLLQRIAMADNLRPGKLYRLKRVMYVNGRDGTFAVGTVLLLVDHETRRDTVYHDITFILPDGEVGVVSFLGENIPRYLEPCHSSNNSNNRINGS